MYIQMRHCAKASIEKFENWNIKQMALLVPSAHRGICSQRLVNFSSKPFPIPCLCQKKDTKGLGKPAFHEISLVKIQEYVSPFLTPSKLSSIYQIQTIHEKCFWNAYNSRVIIKSQCGIGEYTINVIQPKSFVNQHFHTISEEKEQSWLALLPVSRPPLVSKLRKT